MALLSGRNAPVGLTNNGTYDSIGPPSPMFTSAAEIAAAETAVKPDGEGRVDDRRRERLIMAGLLLWSLVASVAAVSLAAWPPRDSHAGKSSRGRNQGVRKGAVRGDGVEVDSSFATATAGTVGVSRSRDAWCLPNAVHQTFSGLVLKSDEGIMPPGKWEGDHWWYHDEITNGFHILATVGGDTYGFWDLSILSSAGRTDYTAAYKGDECLYYQEQVEVGKPFDQDALCRGSSWAGNVSLQEKVEYGYSTGAERWAGMIPEDYNVRGWGLPPGTESLVDVQRNPANADEVRLLYHRVVAPAKGVLAWAGGDTVAFDFVFTGVESMAETEVLDLGKVPKICEIKAGEFHDQQARKNAGGAGRSRQRRRTSSSAAASKPISGHPETTTASAPQADGVSTHSAHTFDEDGERATVANRERSPTSDPNEIISRQVTRAALNKSATIEEKRGRGSGFGDRSRQFNS